MALKVAVTAVAQARAVDEAEAEECLQVGAGDVVAAESRVDDALELAVVGVHARVDHRDGDRVVAGRQAPGGLDVHTVVVPLEAGMPRVAEIPGDPVTRIVPAEPTRDAVVLARTEQPVVNRPVTERFELTLESKPAALGTTARASIALRSPTTTPPEAVTAARIWAGVVPAENRTR